MSWTLPVNGQFWQVVGYVHRKAKEFWKIHQSTPWKQLNTPTQGFQSVWSFATPWCCRSLLSLLIWRSLLSHMLRRTKRSWACGGRALDNAGVFLMNSIFILHKVYWGKGPRPQYHASIKHSLLQLTEVLPLKKGEPSRSTAGVRNDESVMMCWVQAPPRSTTWVVIWPLYSWIYLLECNEFNSLLKLYMKK